MDTAATLTDRRRPTALERLALGRISRAAKAVSAAVEAAQRALLDKQIGGDPLRDLFTAQGAAFRLGHQAWCDPTVPTLAAAEVTHDVALIAGVYDRAAALDSSGPVFWAVKPRLDAALAALLLLRTLSAALLEQLGGHPGLGEGMVCQDCGIQHAGVTAGPDPADELLDPDEEPNPPITTCPRCDRERQRGL
jgi:hypothetical protein